MYYSNSKAERGPRNNVNLEECEDKQGGDYIILLEVLSLSEIIRGRQTNSTRV